MAITTHPPIFINDYIKEKLGNLVDLDVPFFPTSPSTIDQLTQNFPNLTNSAGLFAVYDRMFKMNRKSFPHIKNEQVLYYFYGTAQDAIPALLDATQVISDLLDRYDESAEEVNRWLQSKLVDGIYKEKFLPVHFHYFKIFQLEETRDIIDFGTARTYAGNKIIIDYCYHTMGHYTGKYIDAPNKYDPDRKAAELDPTKYNGTTI